MEPGVRPVALVVMTVPPGPDVGVMVNGPMLLVQAKTVETPSTAAAVAPSSAAPPPWVILTMVAFIGTYLVVGLDVMFKPAVVPCRSEGRSRPSQGRLA